MNVPSVLTWCLILERSLVNIPSASSVSSNMRSVTMMACRLIVRFAGRLLCLSFIAEYISRIFPGISILPNLLQPWNVRERTGRDLEGNRRKWSNVVPNQVRTCFDVGNSGLYLILFCQPSEASYLSFEVYSGLCWKNGCGVVWCNAIALQYLINASGSQKSHEGAACSPACLPSVNAVLHCNTPPFYFSLYK